MFSFLLTSILPNGRTIIYSSLIGLLLGALGTHWLHGKFDAAAERGVYRDTVYKTLKQREVITKIETKYIQVAAAQPEKSREIIKEVIKYVQTEPVSFLSIGTVRMLNLARDRSADAAAVRAAAEQLDAEGKAPSQVTGKDLVVSDAEIALMYNELASRHDALIDSINAQQEALR